MTYLCAQNLHKNEQKNALNEHKFIDHITQRISDVFSNYETLNISFLDTANTKNQSISKNIDNSIEIEYEEEYQITIDNDENTFKLNKSSKHHYIDFDSIKNLTTVFDRIHEFYMKESNKIFKKMLRESLVRYLLHLIYT